MAVFFSKKKSLLKVFFQVQKWSSFGLIFLKLGLPEKLGTLNVIIAHQCHDSMIIAYYGVIITHHIIMIAHHSVMITQHSRIIHFSVL